MEESQKNVERKVNDFIKTHEKKLKALTKNSSVPFTHKDTVVNISSYKLSDDELDILKFGLTYATKPPHISKSHVFTTFELLHQGNPEPSSLDPSSSSSYKFNEIFTIICK